jgi:hypothetical protein
MKHRVVFMAVAAVWVASTAAATGKLPSVHPPPPAPYIGALRVADLFLVAWSRRDFDGGVALMSKAALSGRPGGRGDRRFGMRDYLEGTSNPHHAAFEIGPGLPVGPDSFRFPVRLFEAYLGEPSGFAYSDTIDVVRQGEDWRVGRVPRTWNPD